VNLVDDNELARLGAEKGVCIAKTPLIHRAFHIKIKRIGVPRRSHVFGERRFPNLARAKQDHARHVAEAVLNKLLDASNNHIITGIIPYYSRIPAILKQGLFYTRGSIHA
jgi:hypothetical protein